MRRGLSQVWSIDGVVPGLIFNATSVDKGEPTVISSFPDPVWMSGVSDIRTRLCNGEDIPVSTAALVSARFPWVSPAAWIPDSACPREGQTKSRGTPKLRLVDGGYFDNSGIETAQRVLEFLKRTPSAPSKFVVKLIVISGASNRPLPDSSFSELLSPIRTFLSVREERTRLTQNTASNETCNQLVNFGVSQFTSYRNCLDFRAYEFPLGWKISSLTRTLIKDHIGLKGRCWPPDQWDSEIPPEMRFRMANVCTTMEIMRDLTPTDISN
jgi:hypothetical protein